MTDWTPTWLAWLWTVAFVVALVVHLRHTVQLHGSARWWHATHVLMALGMVDMFWPGPSMPVGPTGGQVVFATAGCMALAVRLATPRGLTSGGFLGEVAIIDLFAMAYMFAEPAHDNTAVVLALSAWFGLQTLGWLSGTMTWAARSAGLARDRHLVVDLSDVPEVVPDRPGAAGALVTDAPVRAASSVRLAHAVHDASLGLGVRLTLAVMSAGMTYMLLALHAAGAGHTPMPGMPGMPGM